MWHIFLDNSGSTCERTEYWNKAKEIINKIKDYKLYCWNSYLTDDQYCTHDILKYNKAEGGTDIRHVALYLVGKNITNNIMIITDGEVWPGTVKEASCALENYKFKNVIIYICGENLSVGASFSRNCEVELRHLLTGEIFYSINNEDLEMLKNIEDISYETFNVKYDKLRQVVATQIRGYNKNNPKLLSLRNKLITMGKKITKEKRDLDTAEAKKQAGRDTIISVQNSNLSNIEKIQQCDQIVKKLLSKYNDNDGDNLQKKLNDLYNLTNGCLENDFSVSGIRSYKMGHATTSTLVSKDTIVQEDIKMENIDKLYEFTCPVTLDEGRLCLLIKKGEPVLQDIPKEIVNPIIENPLRLLTPLYREYLVKFFKRFDKGLSLEVITDNLFNHISPETRNQVEKYFMVFGDNKEFTKATDAALLHTVAGGKRLGNANLWYTVFWYTIKYKIIKEAEFLENYLEQIENALKYRLFNSRMSASMTGLPNHFNILLPFAEAVYFIYGCGHIQNQFMPNEEAFRIHLPYLFVFKKLIELLNWHVSNKALNHMKLTSAMISLVWACKESNNPHQSYEYYKTIIRALTQNSYSVNLNNLQNNTKGYDQKEYKQKESDQFTRMYKIVPFVPLDGKASKEQSKKVYDFLCTRIPKCKNLSIEEIQTLFDRINIQVKINELGLPKEYKTYSIENNWLYPDALAYVVPIDERTCRPQLYENNDHWSDCLYKKTKLKPKDTMSTLKMFMEFVCRHQRIPNQDEYIIYLYNKICLKHDEAILVNNTKKKNPNNLHSKNTLCKNTVQYYEVAFQSYKPIIAKLSIAEIIERYRANVSVKAREYAMNSSLKNVG